MDSWEEINYELDAAQFEKEANNPDEIVLEFGEDERLYVSRQVLVRASPVFRAMFDHDCKEKEEGKVKIDDISTDDFKEFLLCIDPGSLKELNYENVLQVVAIAEKYQNEPLKSKCKNTMVAWLKDCKLEAQRGQNTRQHGAMVLKSLKITAKANELGYSDVLAPAVDALSRYSSNLYRKTGRAVKSSSQLKNPPTMGFGLNSLPGNLPQPNRLCGFGFTEATRVPQPRQLNANVPVVTCEATLLVQCVESFDKLPAGLQNEIRKKRLAHIEDDQFIS